MQNTNELIAQLSNNFTDIIYTDIIKTKYPELYWGGNGLGDRWCKKNIIMQLFIKINLQKYTVKILMILFQMI
jgi:hypothetical protein